MIRRNGNLLDDIWTVSIRHCGVDRYEMYDLSHTMFEEWKGRLEESFRRSCSLLGTSEERERKSVLCETKKHYL